MTYKQGSRGIIVKQIQKALGCAPDGIWGPVTTEALKVWQAEHDLVPDGIAGPKTLAKLLPVAVADTLHLRKSRRRIDEIIIHCSATVEGKDYTVADIRRWHLQRGYADIGYHYVVYRDGTVHEGRSVDQVGAHCQGHNARSIGICYVGGLAADGKTARDTRTEEQRAALLSLLVDLRKLYPKARILGHRDTSPDRNGDGKISPNEYIKACPSFDAQREYSRL